VNSNSSTICTTQWLESSTNTTTGVKYPTSYVFCDNSNPYSENWQWYFSQFTSLGSFQLTLAHEYIDPEYVSTLYFPNSFIKSLDLSKLHYKLLSIQTLKLQFKKTKRKLHECWHDEFLYIFPFLWKIPTTILTNQSSQRRPSTLRLPPSLCKIQRVSNLHYERGLQRLLSTECSIAWYSHYLWVFCLGYQSTYVSPFCHCEYIFKLLVCAWLTYKIGGLGYGMDSWSINLNHVIMNMA